MMIELIIITAVWLVSYFTLPKILKLYSNELDEKTVNPVQKINFGTINAILFLLLLKSLLQLFLTYPGQHSLIRNGKRLSIKG